MYDHRMSNNSTGHILEIKQEHSALFEGPELVQAYFFERETYNSLFFLFHLQAFARAGGFDLFLMILEPPSDKTCTFRPQMDNFVRVLNLLISLREFMDPVFFEGIVVRFRDLAMDFVKNQITEEDMRTITKHQVTSLTNGLDRLLNYMMVTKRHQERQTASSLAEPDSDLYSPTFHLENVQKYVDLMQLQFAAHLIRMPVLEKKFSGFAIISQKIKDARTQKEQQKALKASKEPTSDAQRRLDEADAFGRKGKWVTTEHLAEWLEEQRVFSLIFEGSLHSEVIKKSSFIVEFLYNTGHLKANQLDLMWEGAMKKHEAYKTATLKMIIYVASKARLPELRHLFDKVKETPLNQVDKFIVILLKTIAKNIATTIDTDQSKAS
mmetsp:Transcript_14933/g.23136  ORF Transcript_14933/g.23136 Transcript_14933/m.23136 type:complete len:381 (+) Transcript_14933:634-1776(+)